MGGTRVKAEDRQLSTTRVETINYAALYVRYTIPTSALVQETVAILSPAVPLASGFAFAMQASRPPNQLQRWAARDGREALAPVAAIDPTHAQRRDRLRDLVIGESPVARWEFLPPIPEPSDRASVILDFLSLPIQEVIAGEDPKPLRGKKQGKTRSRTHSVAVRCSVLLCCLGVLAAVVAAIIMSRMLRSLSIENYYLNCDSTRSKCTRSASFCDAQHLNCTRSVSFLPASPMH